MSTCREEVLSAITALQRLSGGKPVSPAEVIREMQRVGTAFPEQTIRTEIVSRLCVDAPVHHGTVWPDLRRVGRGLYMMAAAGTQEEAVSALATALQPVPPVPGPTSRPWPWEGTVQAAFAGYLVARRWEITGSADTASKARGVDVLAVKGKRRLGAEVKGWPSSGYADPRRAEEVKPTPPTSQAGHWFSQALMKALMLLDTHPDFESLVVVPEYARYRDLAARTRTGRTAAGVHVLFVREDGSAESESWTA